MKKLILIAAMFTGIYANASMNVKAVFQGPVCHGDATGYISLVMDGGNSPYSYAWSNGATSSSISNLTAGSYLVTVTDNNGVSSVSSISIGEPFQLALNTMVINANANGASNGIISLNVRGGTPGYSYAWSNSASTKDIGSLPAGDYTVTVTDAEGCQSTLTSTVSEPPHLMASSGHGNSRSLTSGVDQSNSSTLSIYPNPANSSINLRMQSAGEAEYSLINANGEVVKAQKFNTAETNADVSNLPAGNYIVQIKTAQGVTNQNIVIAK